MCTYCICVYMHCACTYTRAPTNSSYYRHDPFHTNCPLRQKSIKEKLWQHECQCTDPYAGPTHITDHLCVKVKGMGVCVGTFTHAIAFKMHYHMPYYKAFCLLSRKQPDIIKVTAYVCAYFSLKTILNKYYKIHIHKLCYKCMRFVLYVMVEIQTIVFLVIRGMCSFKMSELPAS